MTKEILDGAILLEKRYADLLDFADKSNGFVLVIIRDLRQKFPQTSQVQKLKVTALRNGGAFASVIDRGN